MPVVPAQPAALPEEHDPETRLEATWPEYSARYTRLSLTQASILAAATIGTVLLAVLGGPQAAVDAWAAAVTVICALLVGGRLWFTWRGWRRANPSPIGPWSLIGDSGDVASISGLDGALPAYTVLIPVFREKESVIVELVRSLEALEYPRDRLQGLLLLERDDRDTVDVIERIQRPDWLEAVVLPPGGPRTKPRALCRGLAQARGELVTVYDAEDRPAPDQLLAAATTFMAKPDCACLQARLTYYNRRQNLLTRWFAIEYDAWFKFLLPGIARAGGPIPLAGTSNHFRAGALRAAGGWDPYNVTEDADLGVRFARLGYRVELLDSSTGEEANSRLRNWVGQRSRWTKGYMVTLLVHTRDPRRLRRELGMRRTTVLLWALGGPVLLGLTLPLGIALLAVWAALKPGWERAAYSGATYYLGMGTLVFGGFLILYGGLAIAAARRDGESALPTLLIPVYWLVMSAATYAAAFEFLRRPHHWYRTEHGHIRSNGGPSRNGAGPGGRRLLASLAPTADRGAGMSIAGSHTVDGAASRRRAGSATWCRIALPALAVGVLDFAFGQWLRSRGMEWGDAMSRQMNAVLVFYGSDPHLAALGFVWPPLTGFLDLFPAIFYPIWPGVISSGAGPALMTSLAGAGTAGVLLWTGHKLRVRAAPTLALTALVCLNPLIFIYAGSGMSEAVAAPFLIGSMCCTTLFLRLRQDRYLVAAALTLALGFASVYEAAAYGAALAFGLALVLWRSRDLPGVRMRRARIANLALAFVVPSAFVAIAWMATNLIIMGNALYFAHSGYSNSGQTLGLVVPGNPALSAAHHLVRTIEYVAERTWPLLIPLAGILAARAVGGRLRRTETLLPVLVCLSVPALMIGPLLYLHESMGWIRFFIYVLFAAAGWSVYEMASPRRRRAATAFVLVGWTLAVPVTAALMSRPRVGLRTDNVAIEMVEHPGRSALDLGLYRPWPPRVSARQAANYLTAHVLPLGRVLADASIGWPIAAQVSPYDLRHRLILNTDVHFARYLRDPTRFGIKYVVVANPHFELRDAIDAAYPRAYWGSDPRFTVVREFGRSCSGSATLCVRYRVLKVNPFVPGPVVQGGEGRR